MDFILNNGGLSHRSDVLPARPRNPFAGAAADDPRVLVEGGQHSHRHHAHRPRPPEGRREHPPGGVRVRSLLCLYMPAIDRSLSDCRYATCPDPMGSRLIDIAEARATTREPFGSTFGLIFTVFRLFFDCFESILMHRTHFWFDFHCFSTVFRLIFVYFWTHRTHWAE